MKDNFRNPDHSSIINIKSAVSQYELEALIELLQKMVHNLALHTNGDTLIRQDCCQMSEMLNDLKGLVDAME